MAAPTQAELWLVHEQLPQLMNLQEVASISESEARSALCSK